MLQDDCERGALDKLSVWASKTENSLKRKKQCKAELKDNKHTSSAIIVPELEWEMQRFPQRDTKEIKQNKVDAKVRVEKT